MERPIYFRRCHVCGALNHVTDNNHVERCELCDKPMAKFHFFDDRFTPTGSDRTLRAPPLEGEYSPIKGLTVYWESF
jgi:hypothetical protein